jgi:hypothetical protein
MQCKDSSVVGYYVMLGGGTAVTVFGDTALTHPGRLDVH